MKKAILLTLLYFTLFFAEAQITMYESFEDLDVSAYTMDTTAARSITQAVSGVYSIILKGGINSPTAGFLADNFTNNTPDYFSCWIYTGGTSNSKAKAYVVLKDASDHSLFYGFYYPDSSKFKVVNASIPSVYFEITQNQWFYLEILNINYIFNTFDIYVDGKLIAKSNPFRTSVSSVDKLRLYNYTSATATEAFTYYDEIRIGSYGTKIPCAGLTNAYANQDTIDEGDDITFTSQSTVGGDNIYVWSENANPNSSQIIEETSQPSYTHTSSTSGNLTMYAGRSCETNNMLTTTFEGGNSNYGMMVDILAKSDILIDSISFAFGPFGPANNITDIRVLVVDSSYQDHQNAINDWTILCTKSVNTGSLGDVVTIDISSTPIVLSAGESIGLALYSVTYSNNLQYTNIVTGDIHKYNDANISIYGGSGTNFIGTVHENCMANISLFYKSAIDIDQNQTVDFGPTTSTYTGPGQVRGMAFLAPLDFIITGVQVPDDMLNTGNQTVKVVKFKKGLPSQYSASVFADSNDFIVLGYWQDNADTSYIDCNIPIAAGDLIGVFGGRDNQYFPYSAVSGTPFDINGEATSIFRIGSSKSSLISNEEYYDIWFNINYDFCKTKLRYKIGTTTRYSNFTAIDYVVNDCTGIEEMDNVFAVNLYPNPNNGQFNLDIEMTASSDVQIQVFDAQGRYVTSIQDNLNFGSNVLNLDFSHLNAGIYHINIINNEQSAQVSFMITK